MQIGHRADEADALFRAREFDSSVAGPLVWKLRLRDERAVVRLDRRSLRESEENFALSILRSC